MNDPAIIIFLIGGLFLGWSLGANDAANVLEQQSEVVWYVLLLLLLFAVFL